MNTVPDELVTDFNNVFDHTNDEWMGMQTRAYERGVQDGKAEMQAIVAKLPTTKDGVPIVPNMEVWLPGYEHPGEVVYLAAGGALLVNDSSDWPDCPMQEGDWALRYAESLYSSQAAAKAAGGEDVST